MQINGSLQQIIKKKLGDKYEKLLKKNEKVIMDCLKGTPKVIDPIKDIVHFISFEKQDENQPDVTQKQRLKLNEELKQI